MRAAMNRIYEKLRNDENFRGKLVYHEAENRLAIVFHTHLYLDYMEGNYASVCDEGYLQLCGTFDFARHWHIRDDAEVLAIVADLASGDEIFIENTKRSALSLFTRKCMGKERFEKKKRKYMAKKHLLIYSGKEIIKESGA